MTTRAPVPCPEMTDIRLRIDALDKQLVALLADRQKLVAQAGAVKPDRTHIRDDARIAEVLRLVTEEARKRGLAPHIAEAIWQQLIEHSIAFEYDVFDKR